MWMGGSHRLVRQRHLRMKILRRRTRDLELPLPLPRRRQVKGEAEGV